MGADVQLRLSTISVVIALAATACGGDDDATQSTTSATSEATTTTSAPTTTTQPPTTTTEPPTTTTTLAEPVAPTAAELAESIVLESGFFGADWDEVPQTDSDFTYARRELRYHPLRRHGG